MALLYHNHISVMNLVAAKVHALLIICSNSTTYNFTVFRHRNRVGRF